MGAALLVAAWADPAVAQVETTFESITYSTTAVSFTGSTIRPNGAQAAAMRRCEGKVETAAIRVRADGTAPTSTTGRLAEVGDIIIVFGVSYLDRFQGIRDGGSDGVVQWECSRLRP